MIFSRSEDGLVWTILTATQQENIDVATKLCDAAHKLPATRLTLTVNFNGNTMDITSRRELWSFAYGLLSASVVAFGIGFDEEMIKMVQRIVDDEDEEVVTLH